MSENPTTRRVLLPCPACGAMADSQSTPLREEIERLRTHIARLEGHLTEKNRCIVRACDILTGRSYD